MTYLKNYEASYMYYMYDSYMSLGPLGCECASTSPFRTGPLCFEGAQHRQTLRPSVDGVRSKGYAFFIYIKNAGYRLGRNLETKLTKR